MERWLHAPPVAGVDQAGRRVELFAGQRPQQAEVVLVDFVYTRCDSVCSALGRVFYQLQAEIKVDRGRSAARIGLSSIAFDPADDDASIRKYAARFGRIRRSGV